MAEERLSPNEARSHRVWRSQSDEQRGWRSNIRLVESLHKINYLRRFEVANCCSNSHFFKAFRTHIFLDMRALSAPPMRVRGAFTHVTIDSSRGFTIIEVLVVMLIAVVMLTLAVPSLSGLIEANRISAEANAFVGDLQFARSEAIKQGVPVVLCASGDGRYCSKQNTWHTGWIVFADPDNSQTRDDTKETALRVRPAWHGGDTFNASPSIDTITFTRDGFAEMPEGAISLTLRTANANPSATRCVRLNRAGHQTVQRAETATCS